MTAEHSKSVDVFGVGNAMVDILALVEDDFVREHDLNRGGMTLMDSEKQGRLLQELKHHSLELSSGGSAANTMIAIAQSGGKGFYSGKVSRDTNGEFYRQDLLEAGIHFDVHPTDENHGTTGTCLVLTTPDAERTMCTHLGVSTTLAPTDIDVEKLAQCKYSYVEGYLWDAPDPKKASIETMEQSKRHGVKIAFTFSDLFLVSRFSDDFHELVTKYCDVVFCNADEARHFCETESLEDCASKIGDMVDTAFITDGANGCLVVQDKEIVRVPGFPVKAVDTVGAGDYFAGGTLYGLTNGLNVQQSARWGNYMASCIVQVHGARLDKSMADQVTEILGK
ncbi:MAG: adenosine kinase [Calothrix sp. MO_167.B12]|nr:adenosine kinase [Calothrix sp. MO_167.B12]